MRVWITTLVVKMNGLYLLDPAVPGSLVPKRPQSRLSRECVILTIPGDQDRRSEDTYAAAPRHTVGILTEALNDVGVEIVATVLAPGVHPRGEVSQRADIIEVARRTGREAAEK